MASADARLAADARLVRCTGCPRRCRADRRAGAHGWCAVGAAAEVAAVCLHRGEEPAISGEGGIANVFFAGCNLKCAYCQNWQISRQKPEARGQRPEAKHRGPESVPTSEVCPGLRKSAPGRQTSEVGKDFGSLDAVAEEVVRLVDAGASAVGFVSTAHVAPQVEALAASLRARGTAAPFVLNTNAYESPESLRSLSGLIDVYLPDFKYADGEVAERLSGARDYPVAALAALRLIHARTGSDLVLDDSGLARRGLIIRHLVLPGHVRNSIECLRTIASEISPAVWLSLMSQYQPTPEVAGDPDLGRRLRPEEYQAVLAEADRLGFENGWCQEPESADDWNPDFERQQPFAG